MRRKELSRRDVLKAGVAVAMGAATGSLALTPVPCASMDKKAVVSIARVKNDNITHAVEEAIDLLGGIKSVAQGKERIMLKPNLVSDGPGWTTKPGVIKTLAQLLKDSGKEVLIGEASSAANGITVKGEELYRTKNREILDALQQRVFDNLGFTELAKSMRIPLVNLHVGDMVDIPISGGYAYEKITLHRSLTDVDLLCSVPMMKTHQLATVSLGMKNLIGLYPGSVYYSVRSQVHSHAAKAGSPGVAYEILDMLKANKLGLVVIDGSTAMEGDGPSIRGKLVKMGLIVAGTNPLATDMVAAHLMGFEDHEIPIFKLAHKAGMKPTSIEEIEIRGEKVNQAKRTFEKPNVVPWDAISSWFGAKELAGVQSEMKKVSLEARSSAAGYL